MKAVTELIGFWDREFELELGYRGLTVEVVGRTKNTISFNILNPSAKRPRAEGAYSIDLDDGLRVWGASPSTAQDVDVESSQRIGYLFVSPNWLKEKKLALMDLPKWPRNYSI